MTNNTQVGLTLLIHALYCNDQVCDKPLEASLL